MNLLLGLINQLQVVLSLGHGCNTPTATPMGLRRPPQPFALSSEKDVIVLKAQGREGGQTGPTATEAEVGYLVLLAVTVAAAAGQGTGHKKTDLLTSGPALSIRPHRPHHPHASETVGMSVKFFLEIEHILRG
jgi:hypothetical protein